MKQLATLLLLSTAAFAQQAQDLAQNSATEVTLKPITLQEVQINRTGKRVENVVKPVMHQNNHALFMSAVNMEYAFLAQPEKENSVLSAISLPLIKIAFEAEGRPGTFERIEYHTLVKIELLANDNGKPGDKIEGFEQTAIVNNEENNKRFDIKLNNEVNLPTQGIFVKLTIVGRCDANGNLNHERDFILYKDKDDNGKEKKWMQWCQPNFPLTPAPKGTTTFCKDPNFSDEWRTITEPSLHEIKKYPDFNIGFGYTTATYK
jgi:hypothetical protein